MKKNLLFVFALICSVCMFTACGDDNEDTKKSLADEITGIYDGTLNVYIVSEAGDIPVAENLAKDVTITKKSDTSIDMELKDLSIPIAPGAPAMSLGTIKMENCPLTGNVDNCKFANTADINVNVVGKCNVALDGTVIKGKLEMPITVIATGMGNLQVKVLYSGTKK